MKNIQNLEIQKLNNLALKNVDNIKFPVVKILKKLPKNNSLFETALVTTNDELVKMYLRKKIEFNQISNKLFNVINLKEIRSLKYKIPKNIDEILK